MNRPNLQGLVSATPDGHKRAMAEQDKYNLAVKTAVEPLVTPVTWNPLTPINSWTAFDAAAWNTPAWAWDPFKWRVWLKGLLTGGAASATLNLFSNNAPAPARRQMFAVITDTGVGELEVHLLGDIYLTIGSGGYMSLDGLSYDPAG